MILRRLYELASWADLLSDPSVEPAPVACLVKVGRSGSYNGLVDLREDVTLPPTTSKGKLKVVKSSGMPLPVPLRAVLWDIKAKRWKVTDPAVSGQERPAAFLADTLARVLPLDTLIEAEAAKTKGKNAATEVAKCRAQRSTFWRFVRHAAEQSGNVALATLAGFGDQVLMSDPELVNHIRADVESAKLPLSALCTLEWTADDGPILKNADAMKWWRAFYESDCTTQSAGLPRGVCQVTNQIVPMASSVAIRVNGLTPIGCRAEAYLVVGLEAANSYGLEGAQAGMVSAAGIDGFTRALHALLENRLPSKRDRTRTGGMRSSLRVGGTQFLFWTRDMESSSGVEILDAKPDQFAAMLDVLRKGVAASAGIVSNPDEFRILALGGNSSRVVVRDYLERPLPEVQRNLLEWFADLNIADPSKEHLGQPNAAFPLWMLAAQTALDTDRVAPNTHVRLTCAALTSGPLPDSVLAACLARLRAEGGAGFRAARLALIKLCLNRTHCKGNPMPEMLNSEESHPAYLYGRLLRVFEEIQYAALGDVNVTVVDKYYATFSAAPALVFSRLFTNARNHLRKIRGENEGKFVALDRRLAEVCGLLPATPPPGILPLADQGRFALGYYHQKAQTFAEIAKRKADKASKAAKSDSTTETTPTR